MDYEGATSSIIFLINQAFNESLQGKIGNKPGIQLLKIAVDDAITQFFDNQ